MRLPLLILILLCVQACKSTSNQQRTADVTTAKASVTTPKKIIPKIDVTGKTELVMAPVVVEPEFKKKQNRIWVPFTPLQVNDKLYLEAGEYRIRFAAQNSESTLRTELQIPPATAKAYLHVEVSPDLKHVYGWGSLIDVSDAGFQDEKLKFYCLGSNQSLSFLEPTYPDYALNACEELASRQHPVAAQQLGYFYQKGLGVDVDYDKAIAYYKQAIDLDNWSAGHSLLFLYNEQDSTTEGIKLLQAMAKQGDPFAKTILAEEYVTGTNVTADPERAKALALDGFAEGFPSNALVLAHLQLNKIKGLPNFIEAKALLNIYKKQMSNPSMFSYDLEHRVERVLKTSDQAAIAARQQQLESSINRNSVGSVCIAGLENNPLYRNKVLQYQINDDKQKHPLPVGQATRIDYLPLLSNLKHQLNIYAGDELVASPQIEFLQEDGVDLCFTYDSAEKMEAFKVNPNPQLCDCKI